MKTLRGIVIGCLLVATGFAVSLVLVEIVVRALNLYTFPGDDFIEPHPELGWSHVPNKEGYWTSGNERIPVKINAKGLRDREYPYEKGEGTFRILVLGDSFTEALQVPLEETFCKILESKLNRTGNHFEVLNGGFPGVGTDYQLAFFKREGQKYHPDLVVVAFFGNDISDNYRSKSVLNDVQTITAYEKTGLVVTLKKFLADNSCAYNYFGYTLPAHLPRLSRVFMKLGLLSPQPIDEEQRADQYLVFSMTYGTQWQEAWDVTRVLLLELNEVAKKHGSDLAVVSIPFKEQISEDAWRAKLPHTDWDADKPDRILARLLNNAGIPFLPLLPNFRKAAKESQLYYSGDKHWNRNGHCIAAEVIYEWLVKERLVPIQGDSS